MKANYWLQQTIKFVLQQITDYRSDSIATPHIYQEPYVWIIGCVACSSAEQMFDSIENGRE